MPKDALLHSRPSYVFLSIFIAMQPWSMFNKMCSNLLFFFFIEFIFNAENIFFKAIVFDWRDDSFTFLVLNEAQKWLTSWGCLLHFPIRHTFQGASLSSRCISVCNKNIYAVVMLSALGSARLLSIFRRLPSEKRLTRTYMQVTSQRSRLFRCLQSCRPFKSI